MTQFLFLAALLALIAIAFAVSALWRQSPRLALALALGLPLVGAGLYHLKGEPAALDPRNVVAPANLEQAVAQLQRKLAGQPENFENLVVLARSYMAVGQFAQARDSYAKAMELRPEDSDVSVEYAESLLRTSADRRFPPAAVRMLRAAVARNPQNQRALFFLGMQQMQDQRPAEAAATWETLLPLLDPATAQALRPQIDAARVAAKLPPLPATATVAVAGPGLEVEVQVDPALAALVKPGDTLYVFARTPDGRGPPLAVKRIALDALPLRLRLTDADSPMPAARLSSRKLVSLMARLSRSGDAQAASGDIEADPLQVASDSKEPAVLVLKRSLP